MGRILVCAVVLIGVGLAPNWAAAAAPPAAEAAGIVAIHDPDFDSAARIQLTGEILVTVSEPPLARADDPTSFGVATTSYSVQTSAGELVPISGDLPKTIRSGDDFAGTVAVPQPVVSDLGAGSAKKLAATINHAALAESTVATQEIVAVAAEGTAPMPIARAEITTSAGIVATVAKNHQLSIVVENPAGVTPLGPIFTDAKILSLTSAAQAFWLSASNGRITQFTTAGPIVRHASTLGCPSGPQAMWNDAAIQLGYSGWQSYVAAAPTGIVRHLVVLLPPACASASSSGVGTLGSDLNSGGALSVTLGLSVDTVSLAHELGHNLSLGHSNLDYCDSGAATSGCTDYEYGDLYDVMGVAVQGFDKISALNSRSQIAMGFVPTPTPLTLSAGVGSASWNFTLSGLESSAGTRFVDVTDPVSGQLYYLEFRSGENGQPYYSQGFLSAIPGSPGLQSLNRFGVRMLRSDGNNGSAAISTAAPTGVRTSAQAGQTMQNPSGTVVVAVTSAVQNAGASITVTLSRQTHTAAPAAVKSQSVYRFWSPMNRTHFYTASLSERDQIIANYPTALWTYEGVSFNAFQTQEISTVPIFRFWSPSFKSHFYTANQQERDSIIATFPASTWTYEGIAFYAYPADTKVTNVVPIARFWSPDFRSHFYTASSVERDQVIAGYPSHVWTYEGTDFFVPAS